MLIMVFADQKDWHLLNQRIWPYGQVLYDDLSYGDNYYECVVTP